MRWVEREGGKGEEAEVVFGRKGRGRKDGGMRGRDVEEGRGGRGGEAYKGQCG